MRPRGRVARQLISGRFRVSRVAPARCLEPAEATRPVALSAVAVRSASSQLGMIEIVSAKVREVHVPTITADGQVAGQVGAMHDEDRAVLGIGCVVQRDPLSPDAQQERQRSLIPILGLPAF
jgi:hypothetical protein